MKDDQDDKDWKAPAGYVVGGYLADKAPGRLGDVILAAVDKRYPLDLSHDPYDEEGAW